jgi:hypothetical protein
MWVYVQSEPHLYTVGFYDPSGQWHAESDHADKQEAANRVAWLNGSDRGLPQSIQEALNSGDGTYRP